LSVKLSGSESITLGSGANTVFALNNDTITVGPGSAYIDFGLGHTVPDFLEPGSGNNSIMTDGLVTPRPL
jgi:hypothetical protein